MTQNVLDDAVAVSRLVRGQLAPGERIVLSVRSGSMVPLMPVGARIIVEPTTGDRCGVGDIVVFVRGQRLVAHRLLLTWPVGADRWFLERGDGVSTAGLLPEREILGRVVAVKQSAAISRPLDSATAQWESRRAVRKSLKTMVRDRVIALVRGVTRWRSPKPTASA
jgi:hypothetical protein